MIYLVDDNQSDYRQRKLDIQFIDDQSFIDIITSISGVPLHADLSFLDKASCLLVHRSSLDFDQFGNYLSNSTTNALRIIEDVADYGKKIPLVVFSNGMLEDAVVDNPEQPRCIYQIKKDAFYSRLYDFLEDYKEKHRPDLRILAFGKNFGIYSLLHEARLITSELTKYPRNETFKTGLLNSLQPLRNFYAQTGYEEPFDDFVFRLEDYPMSVGRFINNINAVMDSFVRYEENIHTWG